MPQKIYSCFQLLHIIMLSISQKCSLMNNYNLEVVPCNRPQENKNYNRLFLWVCLKDVKIHEPWEKRTWKSMTLCDEVVNLTPVVSCTKYTEDQLCCIKWLVQLSQGNFLEWWSKLLSYNCSEEFRAKILGSVSSLSA